MSIRTDLDFTNYTIHVYCWQAKRCTAWLKSAMCISSGKFEKDPRNNFNFAKNL